MPSGYWCLLLIPCDYSVVLLTLSSNPGNCCSHLAIGTIIGTFHVDDVPSEQRGTRVLSFAVFSFVISICPDRFFVVVTICQGSLGIRRCYNVRIATAKGGRRLVQFREIGQEECSGDDRF